jgi:hypothetical protein
VGKIVHWLLLQKQHKKGYQKLQIEGQTGSAMTKRKRKNIA